MEAQRLAVSRYLNSLEFELVGQFEEVESGKDDSRPELKKAIQLAKRTKAILVIAKLDRLSRNAAFLLNLQEAGIDFVACDCPNADKFSIGILALMAQRERELISARTKAGLEIAKARGIKLGNPLFQRALEKARRTIQSRKIAFNQEVMKAIEEIQETGISTLEKIADCLNKRGMVTPRGKSFTPTAVKRIRDFSRKN